MLWSTFCPAGQSSTPLSFTATFVAGTCDITVTPTVVDWGMVSSSDIRNAGEAGVQPRDLAVGYTNCTGYGKSPKLLVSGTTMSAGIPLFTRTDGAGNDHASGYGVRLVYSATPQTAIGDGDSVAVGNPGALLSELDGTQTVFQASLSCGSRCNEPGLHGGTLNATVTFQFLYE
ncbi:TPA: type 1 fimbrial protein [Enterobacter cloacae]|nr:type 1 fimbrial protein [Enterobacter cloacae]